MTPCQVKIGNGELTLPGRGVKVLFDGKFLAASVEEIKLAEGRLHNTWGERLYRILLTADKPPAKGSLNVKIVQSA